MIAYAGWYVLAGSAFYAAFYVFFGKERSDPSVNLWVGFLSGIAGGKPVWDRFLDGLLVPALAITFLLLAWPWVLWVSVSERLRGETGKATQAEERKFAVLDEYLVCELALADIECWETVEDPFGAVPRLPFGHLNPAWEAFKAGSGNAVFWKFSGKHVDDWGTEWLREGYVLLGDDGSRPYFLTRLEYVGRTGESE